MKVKALFISDTHFGSKGSNADIQSEYTFLAGHKLIGA